MALENKLNLENSSDLAREEERISKLKAIKMFETGFLNNLQAGTFEALSKIHKYLFDEIYYFAGEIRKENIAKGSFRFAPVMYLEASLKNIDIMPQNDFDKIIEKYVEMNIAHPFREGNGRAQRVFIEYICKNSHHFDIDFSKTTKNDMILASKESSVLNYEPFEQLLYRCLIDDK